MLGKIGSIPSAGLAGLATVLLAVALAAPSAVAASRYHRRITAAHHIRHHYTARAWRRLGRRHWQAHRYVYARPHAFIGPGYVFVPEHGILGESCDMPTSACPNELRDIQ